MKPTAPEKIEKVLHQLRKGVSGGLSWKLFNELVTDFGGWKVEPFVGLVSMNLTDGTCCEWRTSEAEAEAAREGRLAVATDALPTNPTDGVDYPMNVGEVVKGAIDFGYRLSLWRGAAGYRVTDPTGETFEVLPGRYDRDWSLKAIVKYPYNLWGWVMKNETFRAQVLAKLGMEAHVPASKRTRDNTGTCPCCFRNVKLDAAGRMVLHGYQRPGWGETIGRCFGVGYKPFELSSDGTVDLRTHLKDQVVRLEKRRVDLLDTRPTIYLRDGRPVNADDPRYGRLLENKLQEIKSDTNALLRDIETLTGLIDAWVERPLPEEGTEVLVWR